MIGAISERENTILDNRKTSFKRALAFTLYFVAFGKYLKILNYMVSSCKW